MERRLRILLPVQGVVHIICGHPSASGRSSSQQGATVIQLAEGTEAAVTDQWKQRAMQFTVSL